MFLTYFFFFFFGWKELLRRNSGDNAEEVD